MTQLSSSDLDALIHRYKRHKIKLPALNGLESEVWQRIHRKQTFSSRISAWLAEIPAHLIGLMAVVVACVYLVANVLDIMPSHRHNNGLALEVFHYNAPTLPSTAWENL